MNNYVHLYPFEKQIFSYDHNAEKTFALFESGLAWPRLINRSFAAIRERHFGLFDLFPA